MEAANRLPLFWNSLPKAVLHTLAHRGTRWLWAPPAFAAPSTTGAKHDGEAGLTGVGDVVLASTACLCPGSTGWGQGSHAVTSTTLGPGPPPCTATTSTSTHVHCKHQNGHLVYIHCRSLLMSRCNAPFVLHDTSGSMEKEREQQGLPGVLCLSLPRSRGERRLDARCLVSRQACFSSMVTIPPAKLLSLSDDCHTPFLQLNQEEGPSPSSHLEVNPDALHYQRPSSVFCKGFPFSSPYPTKKQGLSFTSGQTYLHVDCSRIQPRRLKSCKKGAGDTNWDLPARWELTVTQPWGNPQHRHEFFPTNTQQASQLPGKLLQLLAKGQLGLNLLEVNLLDLAQSGFKPGCGSGAIQVALMDEALLSAGRGHPSILILLDFSTNHEILLSCLTGGRSPG